MLSSEEYLLALLNNDEQITENVATSLLQAITNAVNDLIEHDFPRLVQILYRVDINEKKFKDNIVRHSETNAAQIIAQMLLERQQQKLALRQSYRASEQPISDDEKW